MVIGLTYEKKATLDVKVNVCNPAILIIVSYLKLITSPKVKSLLFINVCYSF